MPRMGAKTALIEWLIGYTSPDDVRIVRLGFGRRSRNRKGRMTMQNRTSISIVAAMMVAAGFIVQADAFAQQTSTRVTATTEVQQKGEFTRLLDSTKVLNQALKRVSEQKKVDNTALVQANDKKIHDAE